MVELTLSNLSLLTGDYDSWRLNDSSESALVTGESSTLTTFMQVRPAKAASLIPEINESSSPLYERVKKPPYLILSRSL